MYTVLYTVCMTEPLVGLTAEGEDENNKPRGFSRNYSFSS